MISAYQLEVSYGTRNIIKSLDFEARAGAVTAIVGPNGSGKTTLLKALSGDISYSGIVELNGTNIKQKAVWKLAVERAFLSQFSSVTFPFTVHEVVRLGLANHASGLRSSTPEKALERVGLKGYAGLNYHELSGGEQQRVQLARVLCQVWQPIVDEVPRWLFLDEPVSSLDIKHQLKIMDIANSFAESGGGVIAVMHDLNLTAMFATKVYLMKDGEVLALGSPKKVLKDKLLSKVFGCRLKVGQAPKKDVPFVLPHSARF